MLNSIFAKRRFKVKVLLENQRNLSGEIISSGEKVKVTRSKEDPFLIDIISVSKPKRTIKNVPADCVASSLKTK